MPPPIMDRNFTFPVQLFPQKLHLPNIHILPRRCRPHTISPGPIALAHLTRVTPRHVNPTHPPPPCASPPTMQLTPPPPAPDSVHRIFRTTSSTGRVTYHVLYTSGTVATATHHTILNHVSRTDLEQYEHNEAMRELNMETKYDTRADMGAWAGGNEERAKRELKRELKRLLKGRKGGVEEEEEERAETPETPEVVEPAMQGTPGRRKGRGRLAAAAEEDEEDDEKEDEKEDEEEEDGKEDEEDDEKEDEEDEEKEDEEDDETEVETEPGPKREVEVKVVIPAAPPPKHGKPLPPAAGLDTFFTTRTSPTSTPDADSADEQLRRESSIQHPSDNDEPATTQRNPAKRASSPSSSSASAPVANTKRVKRGSSTKRKPSAAAAAATSSRKSRAAQKRKQQSSGSEEEADWELYAGPNMASLKPHTSHTSGTPSSATAPPPRKKSKSATPQPRKRGRKKKEKVVEPAEYEVEEIQGRRETEVEGEWEYWVKWRGYGVEENTWEPVDNLLGSVEMVMEYNERIAAGGG